MQKCQTFNDSSCLNAACLCPLKTVIKDWIEDHHFKEAPLNKLKEMANTRPHIEALTPNVTLQRKRSIFLIIFNETPHGTHVVVVDASDKSDACSLAQLFGHWSCRHAAAANHIFQQSVTSVKQQTP